jgi:hypothetical protein
VLRIPEQHHETHVHVVLLVAVKQRHAWIIGNEFDGGLFLGLN